MIDRLRNEDHPVLTGLVALVSVGLVVGLVLGGVIVAPIAARLAGRLPHAPMGVMVGGLIILVNSIAVLGSFADLPLSVDLALIVGWIVLVAQVAWKAWLRERAGRTQDDVPTEPTPA